MRLWDRWHGLGRRSAGTWAGRPDRLLVLLQQPWRCTLESGIWTGGLALDWLEEDYPASNLIVVLAGKGQQAARTTRPSPGAAAVAGQWQDHRRLTATPTALPVPAGAKQGRTQPARRQLTTFSEG
jgi:hypothetical protein